jgi:transposase
VRWVLQCAASTRISVDWSCPALAGRSILVIVWHLLADPDAHYRDLGPDYVRHRADPQRRTRSHVRQLESLGYTVTLTPVA